MSGRQETDGGGPVGVRLGLSEAAFAGDTHQTPAQFLERAAALGFDTVELGAPAIERFLDGPVPTVPLVPPPEDGLELGLLELEEDVLRDAYELARGTFDAQTRQWRTRVPLAPLDDLRDAARRSGLTISLLNWPGLVLLSDAEVDYVLRAARAIGARVVSTPLSPYGPRRLAPFARRLGVSISFAVSTSTAGLEALFTTHGPEVGVSLDVNLFDPRAAAPLPVMTTHADRISHVRLRGTPHQRRTSDASAGQEVLRAISRNAWAIPAIFVPDVDRDATGWTVAADALAYCRQSLERH